MGNRSHRRQHPLPLDLYRPPGPKRDPLADHAAGRRRRRVLRAHRRFRLRDPDRQTREGATAVTTDLGMRFEEHVSRALDSLPSELARGLENVAIVIEDENPED